MYKRTVFLLFVALFTLVPVANGVTEESARVAVVYPQGSAAYGKVFDEIIEGISATTPLEVTRIPIADDATNQAVHAEIAKNNVKGVIALGQTALQPQTSQSATPVIYGGTAVMPGVENGISLMGDPELFFAKLKAFAPKVKRVFTVYNEQNSGWLIERSKRAAAKRNLELRAYAAEDLRDAVLKFKVIFDEARDTTDAIWLTLDNVIPDKTVLPLALEVSWERRVIVFSNNPLHTKRGALFSLYPDNRRMGESLGNMLLRQLKDTGKPELVPLSDMKMAINERTAAHLGLTLEGADYQQFDLVYPSR
ncbi:MAG: ABC transporter substrate binding protein [Pseudomonadota bacterium]